MDEDSDGVRIKIIPCAKEQFRRRIEATKVLEDDFSVPNSAAHARFLAEARRSSGQGNTRTEEALFRSTLKLVQHVLHKPQQARGSDGS